MSTRAVRVSLILLALAGCRSQIQHGLEERDANEVLTELVSRGFSAQKIPEKGKKPTFSIEVPDDVAADALRVLTELKLPRKGRKTTQALIETNSLIETPQAERLRALEAQEGDLEEALETMDGVKSAAVELVVPPPGRPGIPVAPSKASVLLRIHPDAFERLEHQRTELRALVAGSVEGLRLEDVVLVFDVVAVQSRGETIPSGIAGADALRTAVVVLTSVLAACAGALLLVLSRLKKRHTQAAPLPATTPPPQRPVIAPHIHRKVA
jgi:type III secretion protein J